MRINVQEILRGKFLPTPLALFGGSYLINPSKKGETQKICGFYEGLALQQLRPKG